MNIIVYTDGSCHPQLLIGSWASILFINNEKIILKGTETGTTHNRMELQAVINAVNYLKSKELTGHKIVIYSDSQYVVNLTVRMEKLKLKRFTTKKGNAIQNADLVGMLISQIENYDLEFIKVKAHQKDGDVYNREVDLLVRKLLRENT